MSGPLSGFRVFDATHYAVGPWACALLGQMGAEVIKVEPPGGDFLSRQPPPYKNGITAVYISMNLNKRCVTMDLRDEELQDVVTELVRSSDILIENHRPGFMERRGLGYEQAAAINPGIVYCSASGYGSRGPYHLMGSVDPYGQAISGFAAVSGPVGGPPEGLKQGSHIDLTTSQYIVAGVLAGLYRRELTGRGQFVDTSQMSASIALSASRASEYFANGVNPPPLGSGVANVVPSRAFRASDGRYVNVSATDEPTWQRLCATLGLGDLAQDPGLQSNAGRVERRAEVEARIEAVLGAEASEHWLTLLAAELVPCGPYLSYNQIRINEQVREQRMLEQVDSHWGRVTVGGLPWRFSRTPGEIATTPRPGEDTEAVVAQFREAASMRNGASPDTPEPVDGAPLSGLQVVDLTQGYVGQCGMMFGDVGATVIKVEPPEGDYLRQLGPPFVGDDAAAFLGVNRSKRSVCLDWMGDAQARDALGRLIADADVLITDLYADEAAQHGLDYEALRGDHPRLVYCSLTPYGDQGPITGQRATELEVQGMSGQWRYLGEEGAPPVRLGVPVCAGNGAIFAFQGITAALVERERSGEGQQVELSQLGSQLAMQTVMFVSESEPDEWIGHCVARYRPPNRGFMAKDRAILWGFMEDYDGLRAFCERLGLSHLIEDDTQLNFGWADGHREAFEEAFSAYSADEVVGMAHELGGMAVPYHTFETLAGDEQAKALGLIAEFDYPGVGPVRAIGPAWEFSDSPTVPGRSPLLGEHTHEVLEALGAPEAAAGG